MGEVVQGLPVLFSALVVLAPGHVVLRASFGQADEAPEVGDHHVHVLLAGVGQPAVVPRGENATLLVATKAIFERMSRLRSYIRSDVRGVVDVVTRALTGSRGTMEVISETSTEALMDDLSSLDTGFRITGFSGNRVELEFID